MSDYTDAVVQRQTPYSAKVHCANLTLNTLREAIASGRAEEEA